MRSRFRKGLFVLLVLVVLAALGYRSRRAFHIGNFNWSKLGHALAHANLGLLIFSLFGIYVCYAIRSFRWQLFCRHLGRPSFWGVFSGTLSGFASIFLLGRAGEPVRPLLLARKTGFSVSSQFGIYVLERLFDFATSAVMAGVVLVFFTRQLAGSGASVASLSKMRASGWLLLVGILCVAGMLVYYRLHGAGAIDRRLVGWRRAGGWRGRVATQVDGFSGGLQSVHGVRDLALVAIVSAIHWMLVAAIYLWIVRSLDGAFVGMNYAGAVLLLTVTMLGSLLQLPGVGGGAQVASFVALTQIFGIDPEPAAAAAIVLWLITFAGSTLGGVPLLIREGWSMGELRRLAKSEEKAEEEGEHVGVGAAEVGGRAR